MNVDPSSSSALLEENERRYELLFEHMLNGIAYCKMIYDESRNPIDYEYLEVNKAFELLTGLTNVVGKRATVAIPGIKDTNPELFTIYGRVAETGKSERFEVEIKQMSMWFSVSVYSPEKDYFVAVFDNITDKKKIEIESKKTAASLTMFKLAVDSARNHIIITDPDGNILYANQAAEQITGFGKEEMFGHTPRLWGRQMEMEVYKKLWHQIKDEKMPFIGEIKNKRKNGEIYWVRSTISPILENGSLVGFVGVEEDVTERRKAEELLKEKTNETQRLNELMIGRELRMAELKEENAALKKDLELCKKTS